MIRTLWARLTSPNWLSIDVNLGGVTFRASDDQSYVITAFLQFLQQLRDAEAEDVQPETHLQRLPHFRSKPMGTC